MYRHILVVLDSSGQSERCLTRVLLLARKVHCTIHLLIVYPPEYGTVPTRHHYKPPETSDVQAMQYLQPIAAQLREQGMLVNVEVRVGQPVETILTIAREEEVDLIAMTIPWRAGDGWPEDRHITEEVIKQASIPVLVERTCWHASRKR